MLFGLISPLSAEQSSVTDKAKSAAEEVKKAAEDAGRSASTGIERLWHRIDERRLKNRTPDEIVAWVIIGALVGGLAGMLTSFKGEGLGQLARLGFGLVGAFLGGIAAHVTRLDLGMGPVLIRYEDLLLSFVGAVVLILLTKVIRSSTRKNKGA
jgi:uncharacterized membrane protein YeaQ/YmgE (transglycosylase-associated protein family)